MLRVTIKYFFLDGNKHIAINKIEMNTGFLGIVSMYKAGKFLFLGCF